MKLAQNQEDNEPPVVLYNKSRRFSRTDILNILKAKIGSDHPDYDFKELLETMKVKKDTQARGQEWGLDAVDGVIDELRREPRTGVELLPNFQRAEGTRMLLVCSKGLLLLRAHADGFWQNEQDLSNRSIQTEDPSLRPVTDPARGYFQATHPPDSASISAITMGHAANHEPPTHVRQAEIEPTIPAYCSFAPSESNGFFSYTQNSALQSTSLDGTQGTYYEPNPRFDGLVTGGSGSGANGRSSDGRKGGGRSEGN